MIKNPDGTEYKTLGEYRHFNPKAPEHDLFNSWDEEIIKVGGSPIYYYEVFLQSGTIDPVYLEDRGKIFSNHPIELYCFYEPIPSQNSQNMFGIDSPDEMIFEFNYKYVLRTLGHPPKIGSRIYTPHLKEDWKVIQRSTGEYQHWGVLRLQVLCSRFQESTTTGEGKVTQSNRPDFEII